MKERRPQSAEKSARVSEQPSTGELLQGTRIDGPVDALVVARVMIAYVNIQGPMSRMNTLLRIRHSLTSRQFTFDGRYRSSVRNACSSLRNREYASLPQRVKGRVLPGGK